MRSLLFLLFSLYACIAHAQAIDSIKYQYGYLYYRTYGSGEPVILLSGGPGNNALQLESVAKKLSVNYKAILLEQRGTGLSIPSSYDSTTINMEAAIGDVDLLLSHLGLKKAIIFGHSYGGSLALVYGCRHPKKVRSLILLAPGYFALGKKSFDITVDNIMGSFSATELARITELEKKQQANTITETELLEMRKISRLPYIYDKSKLDSLYPLMDGRNNRVTFQLILNSFLKSEFDLAKELSKIKLPIHLICGRQDFLTYVAYDLKLAKPVINLYWIEKSGHFPMHEQAEEFYKILFDVLAKSK
jgi:proline iminopeptidase